MAKRTLPPPPEASQTRTAWDRISDGLYEIGDLPEWVKDGHKVESRNGELTAYIAHVEIRPPDETRVWLSWKPLKWSPGIRTGTMPEPWLIKGFLDYWRPV